MGLCKCPMKKVTNQFCFEHGVNVCENCLVDDHPMCIVQSYLQWLEDSDYNPVCQLCQEELPTRECVRLVCYDVFHIACLNDWASKLPSNTAPAGYGCPVCAKPVFPASNLVSPVADVLRKVLSNFAWARIGLGLPLLQHSSPSQGNGVIPPEGPHANSFNNHYDSSLESERGIPDGRGINDVASIISERFETPTSTSSQHRNLTASSRKHSENSSIFFPNQENDTEENKYKRRPMFEWFGRWLRTFQRPSSRHHQSVVGGRRRMILVLALLAIGSVLALMSYLGRSSSWSDPMLDPLNNPNIRVEEE